MTDKVVTAVICSVGRPADLARSLRSLQGQQKLQEVMVVARVEDLATHEVAKQFDARLVLVQRPGLAHAIETAINSSCGEVTAFLDDDAVARENWASKISRHFSDDPSIGALGGRDNVNGDAASGSASIAVGVVRWGQIVGNHHLGKGLPRRVDHVKGANMAFLTSAARGIPLTRWVVGDGAQYRNELILSLGVRRRGFALLYDPAIQVDHFPAPRRPGDARSDLSSSRIWVRMRNEALAVGALGRRGELAAHAARAVVRGDREAPGLALAFILLMLGDRSAPRRTWAALRGAMAGYVASPHARSEFF